MLQQNAFAIIHQYRVFPDIAWWRPWKARIVSKNSFNTLP